MRCEEAREYLGLNTHAPELRTSVAAHVAGCEACRSAGLLFSKIDEALKAAPGWNPPQDFAQRVAAHAPPAQVAVSVPRPSANLWFAVAMGALTAAAVWAVGSTAATHEQWVLGLSRAIVANSLAVAWTSMAVALVVAGWFTRRAVR